jgi:D-aspartate oxidase
MFCYCFIVECFNVFSLYIKLLNRLSCQSISIRVKSMKIGIVGAGVCGLTTALELQNEFPNAQVSILADKFYKETTSYVAAGIFRPGTSFSGSTEEITRKWVKDAYEHWDSIRKSADGSLAGVCQMSGYIFSSISADITRVRRLYTSYLISV